MVQLTMGRGTSKDVASSRRTLLGGLCALVVFGAGFFVAWNEAVWPLNQGSETALAKRAQYYWDLKTSGDSLGAYEMMAEAFRRRVSLAGFGRMGQGMVIHTGAEVGSIELQDGMARVDLELMYRLNTEHFRDNEETTTALDKWIFENGAWYRWPTGHRG